MRILALLLLTISTFAHAADRPNILWITSEDNGPHMGCYGDTGANTPNLDALAAKGVLYTNAWSNVPVCAPARTAIITGMYPSSLGAEHMRSMAELPEHIKLYPEYLREAGYYCTNNAKQDYNVPGGETAWDQSNGKAHWKNRGADQPFFAIFNITTTHESQTRRRPHTPVHDLNTLTPPPYYPDTKDVRRDWAQYYDKMTEMDAEAGVLLDELEAAGLMDDTIIMYYGDHGVGFPRAKRSVCNSGLLVPLIAYIPEKFKHLMPQDYVTGGKSDRLVSFVDLAPTLLTLVGAEIPEHMQGKPFLGAKDMPEKEYLYGLRGRMDERVDFVRGIRDKRYVYVRNYMPHLPHLQHVAYMYQTPMTQSWHAEYEAGRLSPESAYFFGRRDAERLYDLKTDPHEMHSLVDSPEHQDVLKRMRAALRDFELETRDVGFIPEPDMREVYGDDVLRTLAQDDARYPLEAILAAAEDASRASKPEDTLARLKNDNPVIRYWALMELLIDESANIEYPPEIRTQSQEEEGAFRFYSKTENVDPNVKLSDLELMLESDESTAVRIVAAELLAKYGSRRQRDKGLQTLLAYSTVETHHVQVATAALNAIDRLGNSAKDIADAVAQLPEDGDNVPPRNRAYIGDLKAAIAENMK